MKRTNLLPEQVFHVYQRTSDGGLLFYSHTDYLVFYTIFCFAARKKKVVILGLCQMPDHIHAIVHVKSVEQLSDFVGCYTRLFSLEINGTTGKTGKVFEHNFGRAGKFGPKKIRTTLAYLYNNPVERKLCSRAEEYRWNYLAYATQPHPFSGAIKLSKARKIYREALAMVTGLHNRGNYLRHATIGIIFSKLTDDEKLRLIDEIISIWSVVDYELLLSYYGTYENVITAFSSNTGSEYDIAESFEPYSDSVYSKISSFLVREGLVQSPRDVVSMDAERKFDIIALVQKRFMIPPRQIAKYFHVEFKTE